MAQDTISLSNGMLALPSDKPTFDKIAPQLVKNLGDITGFLSDADKERIKQFRIDQKQLESQKKVENLLVSINKPASSKIKEKLLKKYDKFMVKGKFFENATAAFKRLGDKASNWLFDLLKILLFFAIFDPKGTFLKSILNFLIKMVVFLINILADYIPTIIKTIIYLITEVIPPLLVKAVHAISDALYRMFGKWIDALPKGSVLRPIMKFMQDAFGKDGILRKLFATLAKNFPLILIALAGIVVAAKALAFFSFLMSMNPITLAVVAVIALWTALWVFSEDIEKLFDDIPGWLEKKLGPIGKVLGIFFTVFTWVFMWPLKLAIKLINHFGKGKPSKLITFLQSVFSIIWKGIKIITTPLQILYKVIKSVASVGLTKTIGKIATFVGGLGKAAAKGIFNALPGFAQKGISELGAGLSRVGGAFKEKGLVGGIKQIGTEISNVAGPILTAIKDKFLELWDKLFLYMFKIMYQFGDWVAFKTDFKLGAEERHKARQRTTGDILSIAKRRFLEGSGSEKDIMTAGGTRAIIAELRSLKEQNTSLAKAKDKNVFDVLIEDKRGREFLLNKFKTIKRD